MNFKCLVFLVAIASLAVVCFSKVAPMDCEQITAQVAYYENRCSNGCRRRIQRSYRAALASMQEVCAQRPSCPLLSYGGIEQFNVVVYENFTAPSSDTEGVLAVGIDVSLRGYSVGDAVQESDPAIIAGRDVTFTTGEIRQGDIIYGRNVNLGASVLNDYTGSLVQDADEYDFSDSEAYFKFLSGHIHTEFDALVVKSGTFNGDQYEVFEMECADLSKLGNVRIMSTNPSQLVTINLIGTECSFANVAIEALIPCGNILWNFPQAQTLEISETSVVGSILAPFADIVGASGMVNGQVVAKSFSGVTQFNSCPLDGCPVQFYNSYMEMQGDLANKDF